MAQDDTTVMGGPPGEPVASSAMPAPREQDVQQAMQSVGQTPQVSPQIQKAGAAVSDLGHHARGVSGDATARSLTQTGQEMEALRRGVSTEFRNPVTRDFLERAVPEMWREISRQRDFRESFMGAVRKHQDSLGAASEDALRMVAELHSPGALNAMTTAYQAITLKDQQDYQNNLENYARKELKVLSALDEIEDSLVERTAYAGTPGAVVSIQEDATHFANLFSRENFGPMIQGRLYRHAAMTAMAGKVRLSQLSNQEGATKMLLDETRRLNQHRRDLQRVLSAGGAVSSTLTDGITSPAEVFTLTPDEQSVARSQKVSQTTALTTKLLDRCGGGYAAQKMQEVLRSGKPWATLQEVVRSGDNKGMPPLEMHGVALGAQSYVRSLLRQEAAVPGSTGIHEMLPPRSDGTPATPEDAWAVLLGVNSKLEMFRSAPFLSSPVDQAASTVQRMMAASQAGKELLKVGAALASNATLGDIAALYGLATVFHQITPALKETLTRNPKSLPVYSMQALGRLQALLSYMTAQADYPDEVQP